MTQLLERALAKVAQLPDKEQDVIATLILEEIASEERWEKSLAGSQDVIEQLAEEALAEYCQGKTTVLNPDLL
jgi:hypothetical protein